MQRCFSLIAAALLMTCMAAPSAFSQVEDPPPGGGSTGGGYGPGGGPGGGGSGGTGTGNSNNVVGGSAVQDNVAGSGGEGCSNCESKHDPSPVSTVRGDLLQETCTSLTICFGADDKETDCPSDCCDSGSASPNSAITKYGGGCGSCGGGGPGSGGSGYATYTKHKATRNWAPWNRPTQSSFGPGVFSRYDSKVYFYPDAVSGLTAVFFDAEKRQSYNFVDGLDGDPLDGTMLDLRNKAYKSIVLKDATDAVVSDIAQADNVELTYWGGFEETYDVFDLSTDPMNPEYAGRLTSATDRNNNTLTIAYRDSLAAGSGGFTAQELTDSPDRQWQIHQITDSLGDVFTYSYKTTQESGRWVVEKIDFPNSVDVDYNYTDGHLTSVDHPNGDTSTYVYGQDSAAQTATVVLDNAGAGPERTIHLTNDYMTLDANGQSQVINQPQGIFRMSESSANETLSMVVPDSSQAGVYDIYYGTGSASRIVSGVSKRYYSDGWTPILVEDVTTIGITSSGTAEDEYTEVSPSTTVDDFYQGTIPGETDETGREFTYEYDTDGFLTKKTFVADSTYEEYAYNSFKQTTRIRDRQGNVTLYEYDANGNMTKQKTGLKEVGGSDVAQPEYAELQWEYYPVGHVNEGLLKTAFDAEWDGSSTDLHRTDYEYNARGLMTKKLESASVSGGDRPETNWTYDANDRVATTTDPGGHQSDDTYNDRGQLIEKEYADASTEQTLYGAIGTPEEGLVMKTKNRRNVVTSYAYDSAGRTTQVTVGTAWDADILDGNADDTPITDRNEQSITTYAYLDGTELPIEVVQDGSKTEFVYDYRQRVIETKVYPYANKIMSSKRAYVENKLFCEEDYYGRKKYYGYRASDGQVIRYVTGAYPNFVLADQTSLFNLVRDTHPNPNYTIIDSIDSLNGRAATIIDQRGVQSLTEYDASGRVIRETKAVGTPVEAITEMDYDDDGNLIEIRSPRYFDSTDTNGYQKCKTVMTYDGQGRALTRTDAPGTPETATESYAYDSEGRQVTRTDARGKIWTTNYASCCGHSVSSKNPLGHGTISNKDNGGLVTHTAGIGDVDTHTTLLDPIDTKTLSEITTRYDALGRSTAACTWLVPQGVIDPENPPMAGFDGISGQDGLTSQTLYDADLTDGIGLDSTAGVTVANPLGGTFTVSLSAALTKMAEPLTQGGANTTFNADATGSAIVNLNAENEVRFSVSDSQGRTIISGIQHPHDPLPGKTQGDLLTWSCRVHDTTEQLSNGETVLSGINIDALGHTTTTRTNALGHTVETIDQLGFSSTAKHDSAGNVIETRDPNQTGYDVIYDALNRATSRTDMIGSQIQFVYDKAGQQLQKVDAKNNVTGYTYDARGQRVAESNRLNNLTQWTYDAVGNLLSLTDAEGQTTTYTYDDVGQRISQQNPDHIVGATPADAGYGLVEYVYDSLGRMHLTTDQQGDTTSYNFDMAGRMLTRVYVGHPTGPLAGQSDSDIFTYDRNSRMLSGEKGRYNNTVSFSYDDQGRKTQEGLSINGVSYAVVSHADLAGRTTRLEYPDGTVVDRTFSDRGQLLTVRQTPLGGSQKSVCDFVYDSGGRETLRNLGNGLGTSHSYWADNTVKSVSTPTIETLEYTYDANKNPTSETRSGVMAPYSWSVGPNGYDQADRLIQWSSLGGETRSWAFSAADNWSSITTNGTIENRAYTPANELVAIGGNSVVHDSKGNLLAEPRGTTTTFDFDNKLEAFNANSIPDMQDAEYAYDVLGRRVGRSVETPQETVASVFIHAGNHVVCEYRNGLVAETLVYGSSIDDLLVVTSGSVEYFPISDFRQSTYCLTSSSAAPLEYCSYGPSGDHLVHDPTGVSLGKNSGYGFMQFYTGRTYDPESSYYYFRARMYCPNLGRFLSRDPLGYVDGNNLYHCYMGLSGTDPMGMKVMMGGTREVCCRFNNGGDDFGSTVSCATGNSPFGCCKREAGGIFSAYEVLGASEGPCKCKGGFDAGPSLAACVIIGCPSDPTDAVATPVCIVAGVCILAYAAVNAPEIIPPPPSRNPRLGRRPEPGPEPGPKPGPEQPPVVDPPPIPGKGNKTCKYSCRYTGPQHCSTIFTVEFRVKNCKKECPDNAKIRVCNKDERAKAAQSGGCRGKHAQTTCK